MRKGLGFGALVALAASVHAGVYLGSGFAVADRVVVTNYHVISACTRVWVKHGQKVAASVRAASPQDDLVLLEVGAGMTSLTPAVVRRDAILGEDVLVAGYPLSGLLSSDLVVTTGIVNALSGFRDRTSLMQISAEVQKGSSGGPVLDRAGNVVGVVVSKLDAARVALLTGDIPQNVNFAIKPHVLRGFLKRANVANNEGKQQVAKLDGVALAQRARSLTVSIECDDVPTSFDPSALPAFTEKVDAPSASDPVEFARVPQPVFSDIEERLSYLRWLGAMSRRTESKMDWDQRRDFLQTVWYESHRAGVDTALVLSVVDHMSQFNKFEVSPLGARGYMQVQPFRARQANLADPSILFHMQTNLRFGCVLLHIYLERHAGDVAAAVRDYAAESMGVPASAPAALDLSRRIVAGAPLYAWKDTWKERR